MSFFYIDTYVYIVYNTYIQYMMYTYIGSGGKRSFDSMIFVYTIMIPACTPDDKR